MFTEKCTKNMYNTQLQTTTNEQQSLHLRQEKIEYGGVIIVRWHQTILLISVSGLKVQHKHKLKKMLKRA